MTATELKECVEILEEMAGATSRGKRIAEVERLTDEYIAVSGRMPDDALMARMTDVILHEELTDNDKDKMSKKITPDMTADQKRMYEYPIMSDSMYARRTEGKHKGGKRKDGVTFREVPLSQAASRGTDGKDYKLPIRRFKP